MKTVLYSEVVDSIQTGDLLAWKKTRVKTFFDFILLMYHKVFGADFVHVGIAVDIGGEKFLLEAAPPVVRLIPIYMKNDFYLLKNNIEYNPNHRKYLMKFLGRNYSIGDLFTGLANIGPSDDSFYCSELAGDFYDKIGILTKEDAFLTPDDLIKELNKRSCKEMVFVKNDKVNLGLS